MLSRRLNIVHICDKFGVRGSTTHGVSRLFAWWFPRFDRTRFNVTLYALKQPDAASRALEADGIAMRYLHRSAANPLTLTTFLNIIRRDDPDVLHLHGWIAANYGRLAGRLAGVPTIMHEHGVDPNFPLPQRIADRVLSPCTHTAVAVSRSVRDFLVRNRSVPPKRIRVIYNGAPLSDFAPSDQQSVQRAKSELRLPDWRRLVGTIGRVDTQKGNTYLLQAVPRILETAPDVHFLIVGDGPKLEDLREEARHLGVDDHVTFTGHRSDVAVIQTMLDIQVFPSLWEGVPLTVFEAMAMGKPIVSTSVDGLAEVLEDGRTALVVEPGEPDSLAAGVVRLLTDRSLASTIGVQAREASRQFDIGQTTRNLESLYEELHEASICRSA